MRYQGPGLGQGGGGEWSGQCHQMPQGGKRLFEKVSRDIF